MYVCMYVKKMGHKRKHYVRRSNVGASVVAEHHGGRKVCIVYIRSKALRKGGLLGFFSTSPPSKVLVSQMYILFRGPP